LGTAVYPHMQILHVPCLSSVGDATDSSDFGRLGSKVPQNGRFLAQDADEPPCKIWFVLSGDICNRTNTKNKQVLSVRGADSYRHMLILRPLAARQFVRFWASEGAKFPKMGDSLPRTPMNYHAKFDATSFILAREIHNVQNYEQTNSKWYIHTLHIGMCG